MKYGICNAKAKVEGAERTITGLSASDNCFIIGYVVID